MWCGPTAGTPCATPSDRRSARRPQHDGPQRPSGAHALPNERERNHMTAIDVRRGPDAEVVGHAVAAALRPVDANLVAFGDRYPADTTEHGHYPLRPMPDGRPTGANIGWTTGFWPGMLWLAAD